MNPNPVLTKLGYSKDDRLVIIHADDIGMCNASTAAYKDLLKASSITSAAAMVPCSWFPEVAGVCRANLNADMGVHLTVTSEWEYYRWSPISTCDPTSGLIDAEGYFYHTSEETQAKADPLAVQLELYSQLNRAISSGIAVTHLDTHMNTVAHPKFINSYIQLAIQNRLPFLFPRKDETGYIQLGLSPEIASIAAGLVGFLEEQGIPLVDHAAGLQLDQPDHRFEQAKLAFHEIPVGITHFIIHPSIESSELKSITPDWRCRVADYQTFMNEDIRALLNGLGIQMIGYKRLKELMTG